MPLPNFHIYNPQYPTGIDWGLSIASGLVFCASFDGLYPIDLVTETPGTPSGSPIIVDKEDGLAAAIASASSQYFSWPDRDDLDQLGGRTVHWRGWIASGSKYHEFVQKGQGNDTSNTPYNLLTNNDTNSTVVFTTANAGGYKNWTSSITLSADAGRMRNVSVIAPPTVETAPNFIVDGSVAAGTAGPFGGAATGAPTTSSDNLRVGRRADGGVQLDGGVSLVHIWGIETEVGALLELHDRPFLLFRKSPWLSRGAINTTGPTYTMAAGTGEFTLTGQSAGLLAGRKLVAGTGAFTLTGQDASLRAGRRIVAETGEFNVTGQNVTLTYSGETPEPEPAGGVRHYPQRRRERRIVNDPLGNRPAPRNSRPGVAEEEIAEVLAAVKRKPVVAAPAPWDEDDDEEALLWLMH